MDTGKASTHETPAELPAGDPPTIGVPRIPAQVGPSPPPIPVPSVTVSEDRPTVAVPLASVPPAGSRLPPSAVPSPGPLAPPPVAAFASGVAGQLASYVYLLVDPRTDRPFYVGRGRNDRCFRHLAAARRGPGAQDPADDGKFPMLERIRRIESGGRSVRVDILRYGLSPAEASTVEAAVHDALGLTTPTRAGSQRRPATDLNARLAKPAKFKRSHPVVLLRVGGAGSDPPYETARRGWRIAERFTDLHSSRSPRWAVIVAADLVTAVYRIDRWEIDRSPGTDCRQGGTSSGPGARYSFVGRRDPELEERYVGRSVSPWTGTVASNPLTYVGCGPHVVHIPG